MELTTERLVLREFSSGDFDAVHAFASDPRTSTFVEWGPNSEQDTRDFLDFSVKSARAVPRTGHLLAVQLRDGHVIGSIGLTILRGGTRHGGRRRAPQVGHGADGAPEE